MRRRPDSRQSGGTVLSAAVWAMVCLGVTGLLYNGASVLLLHPPPTRGTPHRTPPPTAAGDDPTASPSAAPSAEPATDSPEAGGADGPPGLQTAVRCLGNNVTLPSKQWGNHIINRTCLYTDLLVRRGWSWIGGGAPDGGLPEVSLASKPILVGKKSFPKQYPAQWADLQSHFRWKPRADPATIDPAHPPKRLDGLTLFYSPEVAPWNYAHTLFNELFGLYWSMDELGEEAVDARVVVAGALYNQAFQPMRRGWLPMNNAIKSFTRKPPMWDGDLVAQCGERGCVLSKLVVGTGTRTWAQVTAGFAAPGNVGLWRRFRRHLMDVLEVPPAPPQDARPVFLICDKKSDSADKKRGIINAGEVASWVSEKWPHIDARALMVSSLPVKEQTRVMASARMYMCNEGTLGTAFFLLPPGSVWISVMNVFRRNVTYDLYRPYSQRHLFWNTGGNIDWFAPAIRWVKALHYDRYMMDDVVMDTTAGNFRNYLPNWSIRIRREKFEKLMEKAVSFLRSGRTETDGDNLSVMGRLCAEYMSKLPGLRTLFTSTKCAYGMSWLCEWIVNSNTSYRGGHPKWRKCGKWPSLAQLGIADPRDEWLREEGIPEAPRSTVCVKRGEGVPHPCKEASYHQCCRKSTEG